MEIYQGRLSSMQIFIKGQICKGSLQVTYKTTKERFQVCNFIILISNLPSTDSKTPYFYLFIPINICSVFSRKEKCLRVIFNVVNPNFLVASLLLYIITNSIFRGLLPLTFHNEILIRQWILIGFVYLYLEIWVSVGLRPLTTSEPIHCWC